MLTSLLLLYSRVWKTSLIEGYQQETKFLANFAFSASTADDPSTIKLRAWTFMDHQKVLLFENDDWFFTQGLPCVDRGRAAFMNATVPPGRYYGEAMDVVERQFVQPRPSYVFLLLARCSEWAASSANSHDACTGRRPDGEPIPNGVFLYFHLEMTNPGGYWSKHFSADEQGLFEFHTTMLVAYISLFVVYIVMYTTRWDDEAFVYKIEVFSAVLFCCSAYHGLMVAHYLEYAWDGIGRPWCVATAEAAEALSTILFTLLLLLISKGWMVSKMRLKRKTRLLQMCVTIALTGLHTLLFVLEYVNRDPAATYHKYESSSARVLIILRLFITGWFVWCAHRSYHHDQRADVRRFFGFIGLVGGCWLVSLPLFSLIAAHLPNYARLRYIVVLVHATTYMSLCALSILSLPRVASPLERPLPPLASRRAVMPGVVSPNGSPRSSGQELTGSGGDLRRSRAAAPTATADAPAGERPGASPPLSWYSNGCLASSSTAESESAQEEATSERRPPVAHREPPPGLSESEMLAKRMIAERSSGGGPSAAPESSSSAAGSATPTERRPSRSSGYPGSGSEQRASEMACESTTNDGRKRNPSIIASQLEREAQMEREASGELPTGGSSAGSPAAAPPFPPGPNLGNLIAVSRSGRLPPLGNIGRRTSRNRIHTPASGFEHS